MTDSLNRWPLRLRWFLVLALLVVEWSSRVAYIPKGLCPPANWDSELRYADVVFQGRAISQVHIPFWVTSTTFRVSRVIKGPSFEQFQIQLFPAIPFVYEYRYQDPQYDKGEYIVFARYLPFGLADYHCSSSFPISAGVDPELATLIDNGRALPSLYGVDLGRVPGWLVLGSLCLAALSWQLLALGSDDYKRQSILQSRRATSSAGAVAGAVFGLVALLLLTPEAPVIPSTLNDAAWEALILVMSATIGASYGLLIGFTLGPAAHEFVNRVARSRTVTTSIFLGALLGMLIGITILGNFVLHTILVLSTSLGTLGGLLAARILSRQACSSHLDNT